MTILRQRCGWLAVALGLTVSWTSGCQTYFPATGQTLPSGSYLEHPPQFIPRSPTFPLANEEAGLEKANSLPPGALTPPR